MTVFNRVNLDGKSITETRTADVDIAPASALMLDGAKFTKAYSDDTDTYGGITFIANPAYLQGLGILDAIPTGDSVEGEYLETGRELAVLVSGAALLPFNTPLFLSEASATAGMLSATENTTRGVVAYSTGEGFKHPTITNCFVTRVRGA